MKRIYPLFFAFSLFQNLLFSQAPGSFDQTFGVNGKAFPGLCVSSESGRCALAMPDGGVLLGGNVQYYTGREYAFVKRLADGSPDTTFGNQPNDWILNPGVFHYERFYDYSLDMHDMALLPDGRILGVGTSNEQYGAGPFHLTAWAELFLANGQRDPDFWFDGFSGSNTRQGWAAQVAPNGNILIVATNQSSHKLEIGRFLPSGNQDWSFGASSVASFPLTGEWLAQGAAMTRLPDGKILATVSSGSNDNGDVMVVRLLPNGQPDPDFGVSGVVTLDIAGKTDLPANIHALPDGGILITGRTLADAATGDWDVFLLRLLSNGQPDASFGSAGHRVHALSTKSDVVQKSVLLPDGKTLLTGYQLDASTIPDKRQAFAARFLANGDLDTGFAAGGVYWLIHPNNTQYHGLATFPDGHAILVGQSDNPLSDEDFLFEALDGAGTPLSNYGVDGIVDMPFEGGHSTFNASIGLPDGKILAAGAAFRGGTIELCIARMLPDGALDPTFGQHGKSVVGNRPYTQEEGTALAMAPDGKIVVAGISDSAVDETTHRYQIMLARFLANGSIDSTFNGNGKLVTTWLGSSPWPEDMQIQADGKILVLGRYLGSEFGIARYLPNGANDPDFGTNGLKHWKMGDGFSRPYKIRLLPDGDMLVSGEACPNSCYFSIARLKPDGSFDPDFGVGGQALIPNLDSIITEIACESMALLPDGKILLGGSATFTNHDSAFMAAIRLFPNGQLDTSFGKNGWTFVGKSGTFNPPTAHAMVVQPDGRIVLTGYSIPPNPQDGYWLMIMGRLLPDGSVDSAFANGGVYVDTTGRYFSEGRSILLQPDGKIIVTGYESDHYDEMNATVWRFLSGLVVGVIERPQAWSHPLIYPNPIRESSLSIEYELPVASPVCIQLLDVQGRRLATLLQTERPSGENKEALRLPSGLAQGIYLLNIQTAQGNSVVKIDVRQP